MRVDRFKVTRGLISLLEGPIVGYLESLDYLGSDNSTTSKKRLRGALSDRAGPRPNWSIEVETALQHVLMDLIRVKIHIQNSAIGYREI